DTNKVRQLDRIVHITLPEAPLNAPRRVGPESAEDFGLGTHVEGTDARNALTHRANIFGVMGRVGDSPVIDYTSRMTAKDSSTFPWRDAPRQFASTRWSLVAAAGQRESPESAAALASLCRLYWYPLYAYARRRLPTAEDAQDLTQDFFAQLLEKEYLRQVDRQRGSFRSFLLTAFKHFLAKERQRANAQKRGGRRAHLPLDFQVGERRYQLEPTHAADAEALYERRWALTLVEQTLAQLRDELTRAGKGRLFETLKGTLTGENAPR